MHFKSAQAAVLIFLEDYPSGLPINVADLEAYRAAYVYNAAIALQVRGDQKWNRRWCEGQQDPSIQQCDEEALGEIADVIAQLSQPTSEEISAQRKKLNLEQAHYEGRCDAICGHCFELAIALKNYPEGLGPSVEDQRRMRQQHLAQSSIVVALHR